MSQDNQKFYTTRGRLTMYSFACGYVEKKELDEVNRATLYLDGTFHVKGFKRGQPFWHVFERNEVRLARKCFNSCLKDKP